MKEVGGRYIMRIFDLDTCKARYELKLVLLHFWRVNIKTIRGFISILLADFFIDKTAPYNITSCTNTVPIDRPRQNISYLRVQ
jgi:hypothetical protein